MIVKVSNTQYERLESHHEPREHFFTDSRHNSSSNLHRPPPNEVSPVLSDSLDKSKLLRYGSFVDRYKTSGPIVVTPIPEYQPSAPPVEEERKNQFVPSIPRLVALMLDPNTGIPLTDNKINKKMIRSISGKNLIDWILKTVGNRIQQRVEAINTLDKLIEGNYIVGCKGEQKVLDDPKVFYTFSEALLQQQLPVAQLDRPMTRGSIDGERDRREQEEILERARREQEFRLKQQQQEVERNLQLLRDEEEQKRIQLEKQKADEEAANLRKSTSQDDLRKSQSDSEDESSDKKDETTDPESVTKKVSPLMKNFVKQMRDPVSGVSIKDRVWHQSATEYTTYTRCFLGTDLVDWLLKRKNLAEREHAVKIGQKMMTAGLFHHVADNLPFLDGYYFYRFKEDD